MNQSTIRLLIQRKLSKVSLRRLMFRRQTGPIISFTFDDFPESAIHRGGAMLSEHGIRGTYYAALGLMGLTTVVGEMFTQEDLRAVVQGGHELACHTYGHTRVCDVPAPALLAECEKNRNAVSAACDGYECRNFSFPEGIVTLSAKSTMQRVYDTCRTIEPGINTDPVDFSFLRANKVYSTKPIDDVKQRIRENRDRAAWLILYTHDISATPSIYGCTPEYFGEVLDYAVKSGAEILTIREATTRFHELSKSA